MIENAMVIGEYDTRPEMTDEEEERRIFDLEDELCTIRRDWLIDELVNNGDFAREVAIVMLSDSKDKFHDIDGIFQRELRSFARQLVEAGA